MGARERTHEFKLAVPAHPQSLRIVRRAVQGLQEVYGDEIVNRLAVIYSELVTNAIRHAGIRRTDTLAVELEIGPDRILGRVVDPGRGFDAATIPPRRPGQEGGFGLRIVDRLAARWGVRRNGRTEVRFEL